MGEAVEWEFFEVLEPASQRIPFVFNSPHSGRHYPQFFLDQSRLDPHSIRRSEDHFVDELFRSATFLGRPCSGRISRVPSWT